MVARMPTADTSEAPGKTTDFEGFNFDWSNPHSDLEGDLDYQVAMDMHRRKLLQEEINRKQAAAHPSNRLTDEAQLEDLKDLKVDLNNLDQQRSEYQQLHAEANRKPAVKKDPPNEDGNKKMRTVVCQQTTTPQPRNHHDNERRETVARRQLPARLSQRPNAHASTSGTHNTVAVPTRPVEIIPGSLRMELLI